MEGVVGPRICVKTIENRRFRRLAKRKIARCARQVLIALPRGAAWSVEKAKAQGGGRRQKVAIKCYKLKNVKMGPRRGFSAGCDLGQHFGSKSGGDGIHGTFLNGMTRSYRRHVVQYSTTLVH